MGKEEKNKKRYSLIPPEFQKEYEKSLREEEHRKYEEHTEEFKRKSEKFREKVRLMQENGPLGDKKREKKISDKESKNKAERDKIEIALKQFMQQKYSSQEKIVKKLNKINDKFEFIYQDKKDGKVYKDTVSTQELLSIDFEQETK